MDSLFIAEGVHVRAETNLETTACVVPGMLRIDARCEAESRGDVNIAYETIAGHRNADATKLGCRDFVLVHDSSTPVRAGHERIGIARQAAPSHLVLSVPAVFGAVDQQSLDGERAQDRAKVRSHSRCVAHG
jgi:hypothetical protein